MIKNTIITGAVMLGALFMATSCNDEWTDEQYANYISFKAPLNDSGVTEIYVPYTRKVYDENGNFIATKYAEDGSNGYGFSDYDLPVIVSGSKTNDKDYTVHFEAFPDTLTTLNQERFQLRTDIYYKDMSAYATYPESLDIKAGQNVGVLKLKFNFKGLDLVDKWVLPIKISENENYVPNPRKNYSKAMLRVFPFNDWSGDFGATGLQIFIAGDDRNSTARNYVRFYVSDENEVFFYPGMIDEDRQDRKNYKIFADFNATSDSTGTVSLRCDNPKVKFKQNGIANYKIQIKRDEVKDYLVYRTLIINDINYDFTDYTSVNGYEMSYSAKGSLTQQRRINSQIKDPQYSIQW